MRRLLFLMLFMFTELYGSELKEINEYKVDLYYANGIMMVDDEDQAKRKKKGSGDNNNKNLTKSYHYHLNH